MRTTISFALLIGVLFSFTASAKDGGSIDRYLQEQNFASGYSTACLAALDSAPVGRSLKAQVYSLHVAAAKFRGLMAVEPSGPDQSRPFNREAFRDLLVHLEKLKKTPSQKLRPFGAELHAIAYELTDLAIFADQMDQHDLRAVLDFSRAIVQVKPPIHHEIEANIVLATHANLLHQLAWSMRYFSPAEALRENIRLILPLKAALDLNAWPIYYTLAQSLVLTQAIVNAHRVPAEDMSLYIKLVEKTYAMFEMVAAFYLLDQSDKTMVQTNSYLNDLRKLRRQPDIAKFPEMRASIDRLLGLFDLETTRAN